MLDEGKDTHTQTHMSGDGMMIHTHVNTHYIDTCYTSVTHNLEHQKSHDAHDSNDTVLDAHDSNDTVLDAHDSNDTVHDAHDSNDTVLDAHDSNDTVLDAHDSNDTVLVHACNNEHDSNYYMIKTCT